MIDNTLVNANNVPQINRPRTKLKYSKRTQTTGNLGELIPFYVNELVQPGDTFKIDLTSFARLTVSKYPSMDNLWLDIYMFFQRKNNMVLGMPQFNGENTTGTFEITTEYEMPKIGFFDKHTSARSLINRLYGYPFHEKESNTADSFIEVSALPLLMYWQVYNDYFRDQNYIPPMIFAKKGGTIGAAYAINMLELNTTQALNTSLITKDPYSTTNDKLTLAKACRFHDYFSTIIPEPQKGTPSKMPITGEVEAKVYGTGSGLFVNDLQIGTSGHNTLYNDNGTIKYGEPSTGTIGLATKEQAPNSDTGLIATVNLADAIIGTMNDMRTLVAEQHFLEKNAIFGTREKEILRARYGVISSSAELHTPEYLGGKRIPLNMDTVLQTSSTDSESPQGNAAGYSTTIDTSNIFTKSFDYWGVLMGIAVIRQNHTYAQGIPCQHTKFKPFDFWTPEFNNIGCQPILMQEICLDVDNTSNNTKVWGYKMPWQEYREEPNQTTGMLSPTYATSLDEWTYTDHYETPPVAGAEWLIETPQYLDRTLTVTSKETDQFTFDFKLDITKITEITQFSIPGLDKF